MEIAELVEQMKEFKEEYPTLSISEVLKLFEIKAMMEANNINRRLAND